MASYVRCSVCGDAIDQSYLNKRAPNETGCQSCHGIPPPIRMFRSPKSNNPGTGGGGAASAGIPAPPPGAASGTAFFGGGPFTDLTLATIPVGSVAQALVVCVGDNGGVAQPSSVAWGVTNMTLLVSAAVGGAGLRSSIWWATGLTPGTHDVVVTWATGPTSAAMTCTSFDYITSADLVSAATGTIPSQPNSGGTGTLNSLTETVIACIVSTEDALSQPTWNGDTRTLQREAGSGSVVLTQGSQITTSASSITASATAAQGTTSWVCAVATFKRTA